MWVLLSYEECVCRSLHAASRAGEETKRLSTRDVYLAGIPHAHVSPQGAISTISWPRQTSSATALILHWVSPRHKLCTELGHCSLCVCAFTLVCMHVFVWTCVQGLVCRNYATESKFRILKKFSVRGLQQPTCLFNQRIWTELES